MWPYNDDEAVWLKPQECADPVHSGPVNDNDPSRRLPPRAPEPVSPQSAPKR